MPHESTGWFYSSWNYTLKWTETSEGGYQEGFHLLEYKVCSRCIGGKAGHEAQNYWYKNTVRPHAQSTVEEYIKNKQRESFENWTALVTENGRRSLSNGIPGNKLQQLKPTALRVWDDFDPKAFGKTSFIYMGCEPNNCSEITHRS